MSIYSNSGEVRKIQFTGKSTYVLSLPKKWVSELNLKPGDPVTIVRESDNTLSIVSDITRLSKESVDEASILVLKEDSANSIKRKIVSMYLAGYNIINLKSKLGRISTLQREAAREIVRRSLVGTEIIADSLDVITIQVLITLPELSVNTAVRRMFLLSSSMHKDAMLALSELNYELANAVIRSDDEVDRFSLYILRNLVIATKNERVLSEIGLKNTSDCLSYRLAVKSIERIADHASKISEKCIFIQSKIPSEILENLKDMSNQALRDLSDAVEAFLRRDYSMADKIVDRVENVRLLESKMMGLLDILNDKEFNPYKVYIKLLLEDIRRTAEHASDIAEEALNQTITEVINIEKRP
ncbi:MAG: phosphate uptake regulator PhoU, partial [Nitrososphaeraceae archaeon]|nr:phosphate uptake regulator PhoU [Nitrososphaeraceae archaeon]